MRKGRRTVGRGEGGDESPVLAICVRHDVNCIHELTCVE